MDCQNHAETSWPRSNYNCLFLLLDFLFHFFFAPDLSFFLVAKAVVGSDADADGGDDGKCCLLSWLPRRPPVTCPTCPSLSADDFSGDDVISCYCSRLSRLFAFLAFFFFFFFFVCLFVFGHGYISRTLFSWYQCLWLGKTIWKKRERFFKGRSERNDRDSMMDRKEEKKLITGLSAEGLYSGHSGVCIE